MLIVKRWKIESTDYESGWVCLIAAVLAFQENRFILCCPLNILACILRKIYGRDCEKDLALTMVVIMMRWT